MLYKIMFEIQCPFDALGVLPALESEICCSVVPGKSPFFFAPNVCGRCNGTNFEQCQQCTAALHQMFRQGLIPVEFLPSWPVRTLPDPIRPCLELLSAPVLPAEQ